MATTRVRAGFGEGEEKGLEAVYAPVAVEGVGCNGAAAARKRVSFVYMLFRGRLEV